MSTIKDIAKRVGVSVGTVSNYFNKPHLLSEKTYLEIKHVIKEVGFYPHEAARSLKLNQTKRIGIVTRISPKENESLLPSDVVFLEFIAAINTIATENDYGLLLNAFTDTYDELDLYKKLVGERQVDGLILADTNKQDPRIEFLFKQNFPFVSFGRSDNCIKHPYVDMDGTKGIAEAVTHLVQLGHKKIAYINPPKGLMCTELRWKGFYETMQKSNLSIIDEFIIDGDFSEEAGSVSMNKLLDLSDKPTAVITPNDVSAFGAMRALQNRKIIPGRDISIIGFDDIRLSAQWHPSLTTIAQPIRKIGFIVAKMLLEIINDEPGDRQVIIEPTLIIRESTGIAK